jgi:hypothetical protein
MTFRKPLPWSVARTLLHIDCQCFENALSVHEAWWELLYFCKYSGSYCASRTENTAINDARLFCFVFSKRIRSVLRWTLQSKSIVSWVELAKLLALVSRRGDIDWKVVRKTAKKRRKEERRKQGSKEGKDVPLSYYSDGSIKPDFDDATSVVVYPLEGMRGTERRPAALINSIVAPSDAIQHGLGRLPIVSSVVWLLLAKETNPQPIRPHLVDHVR